MSDSLSARQGFRAIQEVRGIDSRAFLCLTIREILWGNETVSQWVRVAGVDDVPLGESREFAAAGRVVAVFNVDGEFHAMDGVCPHAGGPLGEGTLQGNVVTCPWHGWQFDVTNGRHCLNANLEHPTFAVRAEGTDLLVELP